MPVFPANSVCIVKNRLFSATWMLFSSTETAASSDYSQSIQRSRVLSPRSDNTASAEITLSTLLYFISSTEEFSLPETINHRLLTVLNSLSYPPRTNPRPSSSPLRRHFAVYFCAFPFKHRSFIASSGGRGIWWERNIGFSRKPTLSTNISMQKAL